jgi:hypothetical protein
VKVSDEVPEVPEVSEISEGREKKEVERKLEESASLGIDVLTADLADQDPKIRDKAAADLITKHIDYIKSTAPPPTPTGPVINFNVGFLTEAANALRKAVAPQTIESDVNNFSEILENGDVDVPDQPA